MQTEMNNPSQPYQANFSKGVKNMGGSRKREETWMVEEQGFVNVKCPMCGTTLVTLETGEEVKGPFQHKCAKCKRYWRIDYTQKIVTCVRGKAEHTPIKKWLLDLRTGESRPHID